MTAVRVAASFAAAGVIVYAPIVHWHPIARAAKIDGSTGLFWENVNGQSMIGSRGLIVAEMDGWQQSRGINKEIEAFRRLERPVVFMPVPEDTVNTDEVRS